jgi:hypothetical protein
MSRKVQQTSLLVLSAVLASTNVRAQVATAILREGDVMIGGPAGASAGAPKWVAVNNSGGYAVSVASSNTGAYLYHVWGNATGGAGTILHTNGSVPPYTQTVLGDPIAIDGLGHIVYGAPVSGGPLPSAESLWFDTSPIMVGGTPSSVPGMLWSGSVVGAVTDNGIPFFNAGLSVTGIPPSDSFVLFRGMNGVPLLSSGDLVPNVPDPLLRASGAFAVSALGNHWMMSCPMNAVAAIDPTVVVRDGIGLKAGGRLVREYTPVPPSIGGLPGETWERIYYLGCNEAGDWMFVSSTDLVSERDLLVYNGRIRHREGDVIDGEQSIGKIQSAVMNEAGTIAYWWTTCSATAGCRQTLFVNEKMVLAQGDSVDLDGDGIVEPNSKLASVSLASPLALGPTGTVYVVADVDINGTPVGYDDVTAVLEIKSPGVPPSNFCTAGTTTNGCTAAVSASGNPSVTFAGPCQLTVANVEGGKHGLVFYGLGAHATPWAAGSSSTLCVKTPAQRTPTQSSNGTLNACDGVLSLDWNAFQLAHPTALGNPWIAGEKVYAQAWFRDPPAPKTTTLSNAIQLTYVP